ncbi:TetR/AcrR family transcriptional regulator C-terminal domain-containing protein [Amycolatopsis jiangsuensis]|uniref:AcrR family transcriptional regulator n=1 Tax=Amycolatopsis jiangsuensis TaxID=1181879 RepID=A0A840J537_9PSEU|nr:GntR family transcriptional regulator [Amycolatopsis jiangsuensis]MBB4688735.1 AcrR family transcriptional regulator [Amycolatopsis jiangsuensis]
MPSASRPDPPYLRIAAEIGEKIRSGELRPGARLPSVRQIAGRWGVAVATATRVVATLRDEGLVETKVGAGTVVNLRRPRSATVPDSPVPDSAGGVDRARPGGESTLPTDSTSFGSRTNSASTTNPPPPQSAGVAARAPKRETLLRRAITVADVEGLGAVSMRRLAAELGVGPMSLYRYVSTKDELVTEMADEVMREALLPVPGPDGWRAKLEFAARAQWTLCRRHPWLAGAVSFTRPAFVPGMMAHTEWLLRALDGLGLSMTTRMHEALAVHSLVIAAALSESDEREAEQETGLTLARWQHIQRKRADDLFAGGSFPLLAVAHEETVPDLDALFEYSLARHLDGFAVLLQEHCA